MTEKIWRYLRWWTIRFRRTTLVIAGPIGVILGPIGIVVGIIDGDSETVLIFTGILLLGGLFMFFPLLEYRGINDSSDEPR